MTEALLEKEAPWFAGDGPESAAVIWSQCCLLRNLSDFPFPLACSEEERRAVEERAIHVLEKGVLPFSGRYHAVSSLSRDTVAALAERRLIPYDLLANQGEHCGVFFGSDQSVSIAVNGTDHLCLTGIAAGLQLHETWLRVNVLDDAMAAALDFAFDKRLGYLTSSLAHAGTGLKAHVALHLPALSMVNGIGGLVPTIRQRRHAIHGLKRTVGAVQGPRLSAARGHIHVADDWTSGEAFYNDLSGALYGDINEADGDLYLLTNLATMNASEEEILFHLRQMAFEIITRERQARDAMLANERRRVEDRVARALGVARTARLLSFTEAMALLSSLRLGVDVGLITGYSLRQLTDLLFAAQSGHLKANLPGREWDEWTLQGERADLFRARFAPEREGS